MTLWQSQSSMCLEGRHVYCTGFGCPCECHTDGRAPVKKVGKLKSECRFHTWDEHGRPIPPAGFCGPDCEMRPAS